MNIQGAPRSGESAEQAPFAGEPGHHAVQFYSDGKFLCGVVADFLAAGIGASEPAVVFARPAHRAAIEQELASRDVDVDRLVRTGSLVMLDAEETLSLFMVDRAPTPAQFSAAIGAIIERVCGGRKHCVVRAYGEMVDVLWRAGNQEGTIALEVLWNELAMTHRLSLLCGYSMGNFYRRTGIQTICNQHTHVLPRPAPASL